MHNFPKSERLSGKKKIGMLFEKGRTDLRSFYLFPFRVIYHYSLNEDGQRLGPLTTAVLINVSKRTFKRAVDRNLVRRRIREAYRLNKQLLGHENSPPTEIAFLYIAKTKATFEEIEKGMKRTLRKVDSGHADPPK
ncbi:MAG: ribonuclease P protein component [Bacteroidetes bacterium]|nr:MAG: ribonuclease P protein component [Cytophagales bacterium]TAE58704.1 MAG: ribonuclease P protein component [Bacteroidota bacterium]